MLSLKKSLHQFWFV